MTDEIQQAAQQGNIDGSANAAPAQAAPVAAAPAEDPNLAKAISNGYVEEPAVTHEARVAGLIADIEHAMANNAPMTAAMLIELRALLA